MKKDNSMKKIIWLISRIITSIVVLIFIFLSPDINIKRVFFSIKDMNRLWLSIAVATYFMVVLIGSLRWQILLRSHGIKITYSHSLRFTFIGLFFNNLMPSLTGGDVIKGYYIVKSTSKKAEAVTTILLDRVLGVFALLFYGLFGALLALRFPQMRKPSLIILGMFFIGVICALCVFIPGIGKHFKFITRIFGKGKLREFINNVFEALAFYRHRWKRLIYCILLSLVVQGLMIFLNFEIAMILGMKNVGLGLFFLVIPVVSIISSIPISFAGWGVGEYAYKGLFSLIPGVQANSAVALSITLRLILFIWSLIGLPVYLMHKHEEIETEDIEIEN